MAIPGSSNWGLRTDACMDATVVRACTSGKLVRLRVFCYETVTLRARNGMQACYVRNDINVVRLTGNIASAQYNALAWALHARYMISAHAKRA